jgi:hypothetical protein
MGTYNTGHMLSMKIAMSTQCNSLRTPSARYCVNALVFVFVFWFVLWFGFVFVYAFVRAPLNL